MDKGCRSVGFLFSKVGWDGVKWGGINQVIGENLRKWQNWVEFFLLSFSS